MKACLALVFAAIFFNAGAASAPNNSESKPQVFVIPVRDDIMPAMTYVVRRGVKEAMEAKAELLILDMETDGGRLDVTEEIIKVIEQFKGKTATYVNDRAFSAGAFIAVATQKIYMAPGSVIGAAAPIMMIPGGGVEETPKTLEAKMTSAVRALVRRTAEKNGHNPQVLEAMIDRNKELIIDGEVINKEGDILTLTDSEARREFGSPPKPLLSAGTIESLDAVISVLGFGQATRKVISPTGAEKLGSWINKISPLLLMLGVLGIYLEIKTPGFGLPGMVGIAAFVLYFFGSYVAGLSGLEWLLVFILGMALLILEVIVLPGTMIFGLIGGALVFASIIMGMVDLYPGGPVLPSWPQLKAPLQELLIAAAGSALGIWLISLWFPKTSIYHQLVSVSASGEAAVQSLGADQQEMLGQVGVAISPLYPGGKATFGGRLVDVITQGELLPKGAQVRILGFSGTAAIVEEASARNAAQSQANSSHPR